VAVIALAAIMFWQSPDNGASSSKIASVAVLPFTNLTGDASKDYISDGLAEEVIHLIAQQPQISVAARTSSFALRDSGLSAEEIGDRLGVDSIFEGSIREERGVQRITVQLINVASGRHQGSVTLDVVDGDLFDARERIGNTIVAMLADAGASVNRDVRATIPATEARAYDLYLKGRAALQTRSAESLQNAQAYFEEALRYDEQFAPVHAGLAQLYFISQIYLQADAEQADSLAQRASADALQLDPNNVDALLVSAVLDINHRNFEEGIATFKRTLILQPGNAQAHQWYGEALLALGYMSAARESIARALSLNPLAG
jgi:adenylate cyclase